MISCRLRLAAAVIGLLASAPALAAQPADYERGVAARRAGDSNRAIELLTRVVAADPRNADAQLQLGLSLLAAGRLDEAETTFRRTLAIAPDYEDARVGLARVHQRRGDLAAALAELDPLPATNLEASELRAFLSRSEATAYRSRLDVDGSHSMVDSKQPDWRELSVRLGHNIRADTEVAGLVEASNRFGRSDVYVEGQYLRRLAGGHAVWLSFGGTPDADFRPKWQVGAGASAKLSSGPMATVATIEARQARFAQGSVQTISPGVEQYLTGGHWLTARMINIIDENGDYSAGWLGRADIVVTDRLRLFGGAADAPDVSEGVVTRSFSLFGGAAMDVSERTQLRLSVNREDRANGVNRLQLSAGVGLRF